MAPTSVRNYAQMGNHQYYARMPLPNLQRHVVPTAVLTTSKLVPITTARPVTTAVSKTNVTRPRQAKPIVTKPQSPPRRHINRSPSPKASNFPPKVNAVKVLNVNAAQVFRQNLEKAEQDNDDLKLKLEKFQTSSKNLSELLASQTNDKFGLGYNTQVFTRSMFDCDDYLTSDSDESLPPSPIYDRYQSEDGYHVVSPPYTGTFMPPKPDLVFHNAPNDVEPIHIAFNVELSPTKPDKDLSPTPRPLAPIIEDWVSDSKDDFEAMIPQNVPSFVQPNEQVKPPRPSVKHVETSIPNANPKTAIPKPTSNDNHRNRKACFTKTKKPIVTKPYSPPRRNINRSPSPKANNLPPKVTAVKASMVNAAKGVQGKWEWKLKCPILDHVSRNTSASITLKRFDYNYALGRSKSLNGGYVTFGGNPKGGKISGKGKIRLEKLDFDDVYFVKELKFNLFIVSQMCDKKNNVLFTDTECLVLSPKFKLPDENQVLLRVPRENNMYNVNLKNIVPSGDLTCLFAKATLDESNLWHKRLGHINFKTMNKLVKVILLEDYHLLFLTMITHGLLVRRASNIKPLVRPSLIKGIKIKFSVPRTPQKNGIAERKNMTLIKAARTMLAYSLLPIPFWAETVNTACYVHNRVLVTKPQNKTPYELLHGRTSSIGFMRPFGCPVTILNTLDSLGKFDGKVDKGFLVGYSVSSKAFRAFNTRTRIVQETLHINFLENKPNVAGEENVQQYVLFHVWSSGSTNPQNTDEDVAFDEKEPEFEGRKPESEVNVFPSSSAQSKKHDDETNINEDNAAGTLVPAVGQLFTNNTNTFSAAGPSNAVVKLEDITYSDDEEDVGAEADFTNLETSIRVSPIPTTRVHKDHLMTQIIGDLSSATITRSMTRVAKDQGGLSQIHNDDFHTYGKSASTLIDTKKPLLKDPDDSDYAGASLDRNSTTGECQFLGCRLISWQCKKQIVIATSSTEAEYVATASCCTQVLWIQNQLLDYGSVSMKTMNDVPRLQALVDKKKVIIMEATIRDALRLADEEGIDIHRKVFANMRMVGKGYSRVETPLFEGMIVAQQVGEGVANVNVEDVSTAGVAAEGDASATDDEVPAAVDEPSIPSPPPPTQPPPPSQDIPSTSQRVKKLERRNKASKLRRLKKVGTAHRIETSDDTVMDDVSKQGRIIADMDADKDVTAEIEESSNVQGRQAESQAQIYQIDLEHADKVLSMQDVDIESAELQKVVEVVTTAKLITEVVIAASATITTVAPTLTIAPSAVRRRNKVVIRDPKETATPSTIIHTEPKSKDKGKGIMVEEPKPLKKQAQIEQDKAYAREKEKEDNAVKRYQALKRKPQTEAQARKNMMIYLRNIAGFKMDYFKGMTYDDIRLIFKKKFNSDKLDEEVEEVRKHPMIVPNEDDDVYTEATPLACKVSVVDYEIYTENNKPYYKIKRADGSHQLYLSFLSMLRNFDREDLEIITFTKTQLILLVERKYPLTRFTLDQMLNNVRLEVEEASDVSLELLSSAQSKKHDDKTKRVAKGKSHAESLTVYRNLSAEFKDFSDNSINEDNAAGILVPAVG
nr:ribonuclease H-like domain-containing protein [Tanacetum cinerariifolium]